MALPTPADTTPRLGTPVADLETPTLLVDLDVMERNLREYHAVADDHDVSLRSHAKTHKIPDLAHRQGALSGGAGVCCQTLSEAEVMAQNGVDDVYLSYMVVEPSKLDRLVWLSEKLSAFATTVDCRGNVDPLQAAAAEHGATVDVVLEYDPGMNRVGAATEEAAVDLATYVTDQPNLRVSALMAYEGHLAYGPDGASTREEYETRCLTAMDEVESVVEAVEAAGVPIPDVKVGSTATARYSAAHPVVDEINPGMYPFNDGHLVDATPDVTPADCALTVRSTVISKPTDDRVVVDAGSKSICPDVDRPPMPRRDGLEYYNASEEHGWVAVDTEADGDAAVEVGDRIEFVPPHVCTTVNLHETLVGVRDGRVEEVWAVQARGKLK